MSSQEAASLSLAKGALRGALAASFLSAVADRFGIWGPPGGAGVAWGDMTQFLAFTRSLNPWAPVALSNALGWLATVLEVVLPVLLLTGYRLPWSAAAAGALLGTFALSMTFFAGVKAPLDYSVWTACAGACVGGGYAGAGRGSWGAPRASPRSQLRAMASQPRPALSAYRPS